MNKVIKRIFILSLLILSAGLFAFVPNFVGSAKAETVVSESVENNSDSNILTVDKLSSTATIETKPMYGHSNVYVLNSAADLAYMSYQVSLGNSSYQAGVFSLEADIDLIGALWTPIGNSTKPFKGVFYGNGHSVVNVNINSFSMDSNSNSGAGLFGNIEGASICDLILRGSYVINTSNAKGSLVGIMNSSEIINCHDECVNSSSSNTIGLSTNSYAFLSGSYDGITVEHTTKDEIDKSIKNNGTNIGYVGFYNLSEGEFFRENSRWYNPTQVRVLLHNYSSYTTKNNLYQVKAPVLRVNASVSDIYPIKMGKKATIPATTSLPVSSSYIATIQFTAQNIVVGLNYNYGSGRSGNRTFGYDVTFAAYFGSYSYEKTRAGYTFNGLYNSSSFAMEVNASPGASGYHYKNSFPSADATYFFKWNANTGHNMYFQFAIASDEGGVFTDVNDLGSAIYSEESKPVFSMAGGTLGDESFDSNSKKLTVSDITSGTQVSLTFKLNEGYQITALTNNESEVSLTDIKANKTSGVYSNFLLKTGTGSSYTAEGKNYDSYNPVTAIGTFTEESDGKTTYTINVNNIVGSNGVVYLVVERTEYEVDLTSTIVKEATEEDIAYQWSVDDATGINKINMATKLDEQGNTVLDENGNEKKYPVLTTRKGEKPVIQITTKLNEDSSGVIIGIASYSDISEPTTITKSEIVWVGAQYYRTWEITLDPVPVGGGKLTMLLGYLKTRVTMSLQDTQGNILNSADNAKALNLGVSINGSAKYANNDTGYFVSMSNIDRINVTNNGYYQAVKFIINSGSPQELTLGIDDVNDIEISNWTAAETSQNIFTEIYDGTGVNYAVTIIFEERVYNVNYEYYFEGTPQTANIDKLLNKFTDLTNKKPGGDPVNINIVLEDLGKGILYIEKVESVETGVVAAGSTNGYKNGSLTQNTILDYDLTLGTYNTTVKMYFKFRTVNFTIDKLQLLSLDGSSSTTLTEGIEPINPSLTFTFNFTSGQTGLTGEIGGLSIHSQYYLLDWYLVNGGVVVGATNYDFSSNSTIIDDVVNEGAKEKNSSSNATSFSYNGLNAYVKQRIVEVKYTPGEKGDGEFYLNDKSTPVNETNNKQTAGKVVWGGFKVEANNTVSSETLALSNDIFYNIGHKFISWNVPANCGSISLGRYTIEDANWYNVFQEKEEESKLIDSNGYQSWTNFANDSHKEKTVELYATWDKLIYQVKVDGVNTTTVKIGESVSYTTDEEKKDGKATYTVGENTVDGQPLPGHVVVGYKIEQKKDKDKYGEGDAGKYTFTVGEFKELIDSRYYFAENTQDDPIKITTLRDAAKYKLYVDSSENGYFRVVWDESKDSSDFGGVDSEGVYINIVYNQPATNLINAISSKVLTITRTGYEVSGWVISNNGIQTSTVFDPSANYTYTKDVHIVPTWNLVSESVSSELSYASDVGEIRVFYLTNSHDILSGNFSGSVVDEGDDFTSKSLVLNNGEQVIDYGFKVTFKGQTTTYSKETTLNIDKFVEAGDYSVVFYLNILDTLNKNTTNQYEAQKSTSFEMKQNEIFFDGIELYSVYNGTNDFVPATEENDSVESDFGSFLYRYDWKGEDKSQLNPIDFDGEVKDIFEKYSILASDYEVGKGKGVKMYLKESKFTFEGDLDELFSNIKKDINGYYVELENVLEIVKAKITISFGLASAYYIENVETIVQENSLSYSFSVGAQTFGYTYSKIKLIPIVEQGRVFYDEYRGAKLYENDSKIFVVEDLAVVGHSEESLNKNFEWNIDLNSIFTLLDPEDAHQLKYELKYLVAKGGALDENLKVNYSGDADSLKIKSIKIGNEVQEIPTTSQFSIYHEDNVIMTIAENDTSNIYIYINQDKIASVNIEVIVEINYINSHKSILYPLAWGSSDEALDYKDSFDDAQSGKENQVLTSLNVQTGTTYVVLTDAVKVDLDYNGGTNNGETSDVIYLSYNKNFNLANPIHSYTGLSFAGYSDDGSGLVSTTLNANETTFVNSKGGKTVSLKAKWNFNEIIANAKTLTSYYASENGLELSIDTLATIDNPDLFKEKTFALYSDNFNFDFASNVFKVQDNRGFAVPSMTGKYTFSLTFTYSDGVQADQTKIKNIKIDLNILINTIAVSYNKNLTYNNRSQATSAIIDFKLNNVDDGSESISDLSIADTPSAEKYVYISGSPSLELKNAGEYDITFNIVSEYSEIYQFTGDVQSTSLTISIAKYQINLASYNSVITPSKIFGQQDPNPIASTIVVNANNDEEVKIAFTRVSGEAIGSYPLSYKEIVDADDQNNYIVIDDGFSANFEITTPSGNLQVELLESFSYTYNGDALNNFVVSYDDANDKYFLSAKAGSETLSIEIDIYYYNGTEKGEIPDGEKEAYAGMIEFSSNCGVNAGSYTLSVALTQNGVDAGWDGVDLLGDNTIVVNKKTLTITSIEKVFNQTTTFNSTQDSVAIEGIVGSDNVNVSGSIVDAKVGQKDIASIQIDNDEAKVNYILDWASGFKVKVVADNSTDVDIATTTTTFDYGRIKEGITAEEFKNFVSISYNNGNIADGYISVKDISIASASYSTGKYLKVGNYTVTLTLASINYTFGQTRENDLTKVYQTTKDVNIVVKPIAITISNTNNKITKNYDETNVVLNAFLGEVNATDGYYQSTGILSGDEISIISAVYSDENGGENVGNDKEITLTFADNDDHGNYTITQSVKGDIRPFSIELEVNASTEHVDLVTDGTFVSDGLSTIVSDGKFTFIYPSEQTGENLYNSLTLPARKGYTAVGWKYFDGNSYIEINSTNIIDLLKAVAEDDENQSKSITIYTVWEINYYSIYVTGNNIDSYAISSDSAVNLLGDSQSGYKARYYSDVEIAITGETGYKVKSYLLSNGEAKSTNFTDVGNNHGTAIVSKIGSDISVNATLEEINVTFKINVNIPEFTSRVDSNELEYTFGYPQLASKTQSDLGLLQVTEGTYKFVGYKDANDVLINSNLQSVVDELILSGKISLESDCETSLTATWQGEEYIINFDPNGGTLAGENTPINAVYGQVINETFPTVTMAGKKLVWKVGDEEYISGTSKLKSIGTKSGDKYQITFVANWVNDDFKLTIKIEEKVHVLVNHIEISDGKEYELTFDEDSLFIEVNCDQGYIYNLNTDLFFGEIEANGDGFDVKNLTQNSTLTFEKVCDDNKLALSLEYVESYVVKIDDQEVASSENIIAKTESTVEIVFTAKKGYEFADSSVSFSGNGTISKDISADKNTLTFTWTNFVDDANISIQALASDIVVSIVDATDYLLTLNLNDQSVDVLNGSLIVKTGTKIEVDAVLKYGLTNAKVSTSLNYANASNETNTFNNDDKCFHYSGIITGFDEDFSISFSAEKREYTFSISVKEEHKGFGEVVDSEVSVKFGETLKIKANPTRYDYIFESWIYIDAEGKEIILSLDKDATLTINENQKTFLEHVDHGDKIKVYATFEKCTLDVTFSSNVHGKFEILQYDEVVATVEQGKTIIQEIFLGYDVVLNLIANKGYEIDWVKLDGRAIVLSDYGYTSKNNQVTIYEDIDNPIAKIEVAFKASAINVMVKAGTLINYVETLGTDAGGVLHLANSAGVKQDESLYLPNDGNLVSGADYHIASFSDITLYFVAEVKAGFTLSITCDSADCVVNEFKNGNIIIYSFSGLKSDATIKAIFTAKENKVHVQFAFDGQTEVVHAGMIYADTESALVSASPNRGSIIDVTVVTSANLTLEVYSSFAYQLLADANGYLLYYIDYGFEQIEVGQCEIQDKLTTGYTYGSTITITNVNADANIYIYVVPQEYNIKFAVSDIEFVNMPGRVVYGQKFNLDSLSEDQKIFPKRDGYSFAGYYTSPLGLGRQYINKDKAVVSKWLEDGYGFNGKSYYPVSGYDPDTNTFTLYASWVFKKANITITFLPPELETIDNGYSVMNVITNQSVQNIWTSQYSNWYAEVAVGSSLSFKALEFEDYLFANWSIRFEDEEPFNRQSQFTLSDIKYGKYVITANYNPTYSIRVENRGNGKAEGGQSYLTQDGYILPAGSFDKSKYVTLEAIPEEGFRFVHWLNTKTEETYEAVAGADGKVVYTFDTLLDTSLNLIAMFEGKEIVVDLDISQGGQYHNVREVTINGKTVANFRIPFTAKVGDEIKLFVNKGQGYGFEIIGAPFIQSFDANSGNYVFAYTFAVENLEEVDANSYAINVRFNATKEKINIKFKMEVDNAIDDKEIAKAGDLKFKDSKGQSYDVFENVSYQIEYSEVATLIINLNDKYRVGYIYLKNPSYNDVTDWLDNGTILSINKDLIDAYFANDIVIEVYFERLTWTMEEFVAENLVGEGSVDNPFEISTVEEFALVAYLVNNGEMMDNGELYANANYILKSNLDFKGKYWEPIGTEENPFNGTFDLGEYDIKNVEHYMNYSNPKTTNGGLFRYLGENAKIIQNAKSTVMIWIIAASAVVVVIGIFIVIFIVRKKKRNKFLK